MTKQLSRNRLAALLGSLLLVPPAVLFFTQTMWLGNFPAAGSWMAAHPAETGLFWLLFVGLACLCFSLTRHLLWAFLPGTLVVVILTYISRIKMDINGDPLLLGDFTMVGGAGDIAGYASDRLIPSGAAIAAILLALLLLILLGLIDHWVSFPPAAGLISGLLALGFLLAACFPSPLQSAVLSLDSSCRDQLDRTDRMGVSLGLYAAWCERVRMENLQSDKDALALAEWFLEDANRPKASLSLNQAPDIIFITSESFFDITRLPNLTFQKDPLPVFHALAETCTNGLFLSSTAGGGTGQVEMELFTGLTSSLLKEGDTLCTLEEQVYDTLPATVRLLAQLGYETTAVHSHNNILYNRSLTYPALGFEETLFIEDFITPVKNKGPYASDETFAEELIARYEARDTSRPCFLYGLSMENHQAYPAGKFQTSSGFAATSDLLSRKDLSILDSLVMGLHDADSSLGLLVDYFSSVDRPVMLVFLGDHQPSLNLADGTSLYTRLGFTPTEHSSDWDAETLAARLSTDYLIWTNYETEALPDGPESSSFLGLHTLERADIPLNAYFSWLEETVGSEMLLLRNGLFVDRAGQASFTVPADLEDNLAQYTSLQLALAYGSEQP